MTDEIQLPEPEDGKPAEQEERVTKTEERVHDIIGMITAGEWRSTSFWELSRKWDVVPATVKKFYAEALRMIRYGMPAAEEARTEIAVQCDVITHRALTNVETRVVPLKDGGVHEYTTPAPDYKGAVAAQKLRASVMGLLSHHHTIEVKRTAEAVAQMTDDELRAEFLRLSQARGELLPGDGDGSA